MSELKLISPMLDNFLIGDVIHSREGLRSYPVMHQETEEKYILKVISVPSAPSKLDALLLSGAYADTDAALSYFKTLAEDISQEATVLKQLSELEGFSAFADCQIVEHDDGTGYDIYLLSPYQRSLERQFTVAPLTHLNAVNLGLDLCAALTVARRAGYLFVDLRPGNVYITPDNHYRIGDVGFIRMSSLKYAVLPDRYRSSYTAPEAADAFASLNETIDTYALGLVMYQVYNNAMLPEADENGAIPAPQYADNEMSEIILKACAADPSERWQSPIELGQAIVSYMQRNGINDDPIIPVPAPEEAIDEAPHVEIAEDPAAEVAPEETVTYTEDDFGNFSFLDDVFAVEEMDDETVLANISNEVSEILDQANKLAAHNIPTPAVATEAIEIEIPAPEPQVVEDETKMIELPQHENSEFETETDNETEPEENSEDLPVVPPAKKRKWLRNSIIILLILALLACGAYFFLQYYIVPVNDLRVEGKNNTLVVYVDCEADEAILSVECSFPEGTPMVAEIKDGKAVFEGLTHDTDYSIKVCIKGFRRLTGKYTAEYSTPELTSLLHFNALTGITDGSIILDFPVIGPESKKWIITYWTTGEPAKTKETTSHTITLEGLTIGKLYYFELTPSDELYTEGDWVVTAVARNIVYAQDIVVDSFANGKLSASWSAPDGENIASWTVYCKSDDGNKTTIVTEPTVVFEGIDTSKNYTLEIVAEGMTKAAPAVEIAADSINISNMKAQNQQGKSILLSWESADTIPGGSWITYSINGEATSSQIYISGNSVVIPSYVSGAKYVFTFHNSANTGFVGVPFICIAE